MRLIDADKLMKAMYHRAFETDGDTMWQSGCWVRYRAIEQVVKEQPTVEPERKKGEWQITDAYPHNVYCSVCHKRFAQTQWAIWEDGTLPRNFCSNCGADMRGGEQDEIS